MIIKLILIVSLLLIAWMLFKGPGSSTQVALRRLATTVAMSAGIFVVVFPNSLTLLANAIGVSRGTDLLLYGLVIVFLFTTLALSARLKLLERRLTLLAREQALSHPQSADRARPS